MVKIMITPVRRVVLLSFVVIDQLTASSMCALGYDWISRRPHFTGAYVGPLAKRHCAALRHATNYRQVAGDAGVQTVGADVLFECPRCLGLTKTSRDTQGRIKAQAK